MPGKVVIQLRRPRYFPGKVFTSPFPLICFPPPDAGCRADCKGSCHCGQPRRSVASADVQNVIAGVNCCSYSAGKELQHQRCKSEQGNANLICNITPVIAHEKGNPFAETSEKIPQFCTSNESFGETSMLSPANSAWKLCFPFPLLCKYRLLWNISVQ